MSHSPNAAVLNRPLSNTNILSEDILVTPEELRQRYPRSENCSQTIETGRAAVEAILDGKDKRLLAIVGPCSIHDVDTAKDYAKRFWKGLINDPHLNDTFDIDTGLAKARELLVWLAELGMPTGTEALDPISPQYLSDLFTWSAIGARTTESQTHREMSSGLSTAVGFKNGTDGGLEVALNAMQSAANPHSFLGIDSSGKVTVLKTRGNAYGHIILRGGNDGPNYDSVHVALAEEAMNKAKLPRRIMIDCSHANANKDHERQPLVAQNVAEQLSAGSESIIGIMLESHINAGNQSLKDPTDLAYGVSQLGNNRRALVEIA